MIVRRAEKKDIPRMIELLQQVLAVHAGLRKDIFIQGTTKYSPEDLEAMLEDENRPVFAAADENGRLLGYAMCEIQKPSDTASLQKITTLYIDDLCVDEDARGRHAGTALFDEVSRFAKEKGCYHITLNVWEGNEAAQRFYEAMGMKPLKTYMEYIL